MYDDDLYPIKSIHILFCSVLKYSAYSSKDWWIATLLETKSNCWCNELITQPTKITKSSETIIDHFYTNRIYLISEIIVTDYSMSDHFPIAGTCRLKNVKAKEKTIH